MTLTTSASSSTGSDTTQLAHGGFSSWIGGTACPSSYLTTTTTIPQSTVSITISSTVPTTRTLSLVAASSTATLCIAPTASNTSLSTSSTPEPGSNSHSPSSGAIAGGVIGSLAGVALLAALISWYLKRKASIRFRVKRKVEKRDSETEEVLEALEHVTEQRDRALDSLAYQQESARPGMPLPSPTSFDFGTDPTKPSTVPVTMPTKDQAQRQWI